MYYFLWQKYRKYGQTENENKYSNRSAFCLLEFPQDFNITSGAHHKHRISGGGPAAHSFNQQHYSIGKSPRVTGLLGTVIFDLHMAYVIRWRDLIVLKAASQFKNQVKSPILHVEFDEVLRKVNLFWRIWKCSISSVLSLILLSAGCFIKTINLF
jgi:hypothetical protein